MKNSYQDLLRELQNIAARDKLPIETVEQDYAISFILAAISQTPELSEILVFRGGTALRKCFFKDYRYSMDLDYSVLRPLPLETYNQILLQVADKVHNLLNMIHASSEFDVSVKLIASRETHEDGQDTHKFTVKFPWHLKQKSGRAGRAIKLDTSHSEPVLLEPEPKTVHHFYSKPLKASIKCCSLEEIIAEKFVAIRAVALQREKKGRVFTRPRDYYDVAYALHHASFKPTDDFLAVILAKAERRGIEIRSIEDLLPVSIKTALERDWEPFLSDVVPSLASCEATLERLQLKLNQLFPDLANSFKLRTARAKELSERFSTKPQ